MNLFIDTHLNDVIILLYKDNKIIKEKKFLNVKENSKIIMTAIEEVLDNTIPDQILVVNGPGSFTGVRLGVTIAKTLAWTLKTTIKTITSLECLAVSCKDAEKIVGFSDKNGYYVGIFDSENNLVGDYEYLSNKEYEEFNKIHSIKTDIEYDYEKIFNYSKNKKALNPHKVNPVYIKKLDVEKWLD